MAMDMRSKDEGEGTRGSGTASHTSPERTSTDNERRVPDVDVANLEKTQSLPLPAPVKVEKSKRRGFLGRWTIIAEVSEPKHYGRATKYYLTLVVALAAVVAPLGSAIIFPSLGEIARALHTSPTIANLSAACYMISMSLFPLWWSSFSEVFGRRNIYIISFVLWVIWNVLAAVSANITMFIIMRVLSGGAASSVQAVGAGTIADIWEVKERGKAMSLFYLGPLMGPFLAPIIGGVLGEFLGWRSTLYFLAIYGGFVLVLLTFVLPETLKVQRQAPTKSGRKEAHASDGQNHRWTEQGEGRDALTRTSTRHSISQKTSMWAIQTKRCLVDPFHIILYLRYPPVLITVYYASITFGCLYLLNISLETTYSKPPYSFSTIIVGLTYIPNSIGYILASVFGGRWTDRIMAREARQSGRYDEKGKLCYRPEDRMRENAWIAAFLYPAALIWYGWTSEKGVHWIVPLIANFFFGVGSMLVFGMATTMLTEFMPKKASSGVALNNLVRNIFSFVGAIVAAPLISAIGNGWLFTIVGIVAFLSSIVIWLMRHYGPRWRLKMEKELN